MIFASFGNSPQDFLRAAQALDEYAKNNSKKVFVQYGTTNYLFKYADGVDFMEQDELLRKLNVASVVVLQGGWGTISEALELGKKIVAIPRRCPDEVHHDQGDLVRKLESLGCLLGVYDEKELGTKIELARTFEFKPLKKGSAQLVIQAKLNEWLR